MASAARFAAAAAWAILERGTSIRVGALHDWPVLRAQPCTPAATACSRSASSRVLLGDLPPGSCATRFIVGAAAGATEAPARGEAVMETVEASGCGELSAAGLG